MQSFSKQNPTNPKTPSVIDQGQPEDMQDVIVVEGEKSRSHEIMKKVFKRNSVFQMDQDNLRSTLSVIEARNLCEKHPC